MRILAWDVGVVNLAYCLLEDETIVRWGVIDLLDDQPKGTRFRDLSVERLKTLLIRKLDQIQDLFWPCDTILIENQPVLKNPTMKSVASCLFDYFLIRGKIDHAHIAGEVRFTSPINKLKCGVLTAEEVDELKKRYKTRYTFNKQLSVATCKAIVGCDHPVLASSKKKDDLADAFLLAYHTISKSP